MDTSAVSKGCHSSPGLERSASPAEIRAACRKQALKHHPDVNKAADSTDRLKAATEAYEVLSGPDKRRACDQYGLEGLSVE